MYSDERQNIPNQLVIGPIGGLWDAKKVSRTTSSGDHGSVVTTVSSVVVDDDTVGVIAPSPGELFSATKDDSVAILLSYGTTRGLLAGDAEAREKEYIANRCYTRP